MCKITLIFILYLQELYFLHDVFIVSSDTYLCQKNCMKYCMAEAAVLHIYLWCAVHFPVIHWNLVCYISSMIYYKSFEGYFTFNFLLVICVLEILLFLFASHDLILIGHGLFEEINLQGAPVFCFFFFFFYYLISKQALDNKKSLKEGQI